MRRSLMKNSGIDIRPKTGSDGFTLLEILIVVAIIGIIATIALPAYKHYLDKAKVTIAKQTLHDLQHNLESFYGDASGYPATIDFTTGLDDQGRTVFRPSVLDQIARDLFSVDSYVVSGNSYILTARAKDSTRTVLVLTPNTLE